MQFLVIGRSNREASTAEELTWAKQGVQQFRDDPHTRAVYGFAGEMAGCMICECNSHQELNQYLALNPLALTNDWEIYPLVTADEIIQVLDQAEQHMKAMGQAA